MAKKIKKTSEEKIVESFQGLSKNLRPKVVTEKEVFTPIQEIYKSVIVKESRKTVNSPRGKVKEKVPKKSKKNTRLQDRGTENFNIVPAVEKLKVGGYELIITEKPQAAQKIATALGKITKRDLKGVSYYEVNRNGKKIVVACAVGHLFSLKQKKSGQEIPVFEVGWLPNFQALKKDFTKKYYDVLATLVKGAGEITVATDFDVEGELIGLNVVRFICGQKDAERMKFSSLTEKEINEAYEHKLTHINWGQAIAGETRHYLDWFYGINLSRAIMHAIKTTGKFKIMSIGRVQGPALHLIVAKEEEIQKFKSEKYWQVFIDVTDTKNTVNLKYVKDIFDRKELEDFSNFVGKKGIAKTESSIDVIPPHTPFNLTALQTEAYKFLGITPAKTLQIAQSLYLKGIISYPRTSSEKLPESIGYDEIVKKLAKVFQCEKNITRKKPIEGSKSDPAHPSIYPTGNQEALSGQEEQLYDLIARRFLALFCDDAEIAIKKIEAIISDKKFTARGSETKKKGWMHVYPTKQKEVEIATINGEVSVVHQKIEEKETQPPRRFSPASIITELEKRNLGTKATRASIVETLYDRGYVKGESIEATPLGISLIHTLEKYAPIITDEELTRKIEEKTENMVEEQKDLEKNKEEIIQVAKKTISQIVQEFKNHERKIGDSLVEANQQAILDERKENELCPCPKCGVGTLSIRYSKKTRGFFVGCSNYPQCTAIYSLPPNGKIKKTGKNCESCNFPLIMRLSKGKRPWVLCFNKDCEKNKALREQKESGN